MGFGRCGFHIERQLSQTQRDHGSLDFPVENMGFFPDFLALKVTGSNPQKLYLGTHGYKSQGQGSWDTSEGPTYHFSARVVLTGVLFGLGYSNA